MARYIVFEHDQDPDFSWLQDHATAASPIYPTAADMKAGRNAYDPDYYNDPDNHVALQMTVCKPGTGEHGRPEGLADVIDSLGGIDFLRESDDWTTGTFWYVNDIPKRCRYQRDLARNAGLRYRPRR